MPTQTNGHTPIPSLGIEGGLTGGNQSALKGFDDDSGLRVVKAKFIAEEPFSWDLFEGYDTLRALTYTASIDTIVRMLDKFSFDTFECVFGYEGILGSLGKVLAFQQIVRGDTLTAISGLKDGHRRILKDVHDGRAHFHVLRESVSHAKLYLLSSSNGRRRVIVGSANLSERAFSGKQAELIQNFEDDDEAWEYYTKIFNRIRDSASDEIQLPEEKIISTKVEVSDAAVLSGKKDVVVYRPPTADEKAASENNAMQRVDKLEKVQGPHIFDALPPVHKGKQFITPKVRQEITKIHRAKSADEADHKWFSINRTERTAQLNDKPFPLESDDARVKNDVRWMLQYFKNFDAFQGDVYRLQERYFGLMSWLYFSPFMCDMRSQAYNQDKDIIRYPQFAVVHGTNSCGKTKLVETVMISMFNFPPRMHKSLFRTDDIRSVLYSYKRLPVLYDDIETSQFSRTGRTFIKDDTPPAVIEYPGIVLSMNTAEKVSFPGEIKKRSFLIYTSTALADHDEVLRQRLDREVRKIRNSLTGHLYRRYIQEVMERLEQERLPDDWLGLSSGVLSSIISGFIDRPTPPWCKKIPYSSSTLWRYDRERERLRNLFMDPTRQTDDEEWDTVRWRVEGDRIIVFEQQSRAGFKWEDIPSTLRDVDASIGGRTILYKKRVEEFIGQGLGPARPRSWWQPWRRG